MGRPGGCTTQSPGAISDQFLSTKVSLIGSGTLRVRGIPYFTYSGKYYALFINGVYTGYNYFCPPGETLEIFTPLDPGTTSASAFFEDAGGWAVFENGFVPLGGVETDEALSAARLQINWNTSYTLTPVRGDTQLSSITITGAQRFTNVAATNLPTRGKLHYQILLTNTATNYIVRWWAGYTLVAEGTRVGNGVVTCNAINNSGLTVVCTLAYTGDVTPGTAFLEVRWPASYQIHYSTSALVFPRAPESTVTDSGGIDYVFLTPVLAVGAYNWNVLTVDDDGDVQTASIPVTVALTINNVPLPPTVTTVTGNAAALVVNWTVGQAGCTYTVYSSLIGYPTNLSHYAAPAAVTTALNATSATLPAVAGYPGKVRVIVRATSGGKQEDTDTVTEIELDAAGNLVGGRPNRANINAFTLSGLQITADVIVMTEDAIATPDFIDLYVQATAVDVTSAQASAALPVEVSGVGIQRTSVSYTVGAPGWYRVAVNARVNATGARSAQYREYVVYIDNTPPGAVGTLTSKVIRGQ